MRSFFLAAALAAAGLVGGGASADEPKRVVAVVTSEHPQTQLMGMVLTMQAIQQGAVARILLCGPAGDLALAEPPAAATAPQAPMGMSPHGLMRKIIETGATVEVCALYLPNKGLSVDALAPGVGAAEPPAMAAALLGDNTLVLNF